MKEGEGVSKWDRAGDTVRYKGCVSRVREWGREGTGRCEMRRNEGGS